jgi:hypothetical protein
LRHFVGDPRLMLGYLATRKAAGQGEIVATRRKLAAVLVAAAIVVPTGLSSTGGAWAATHSQVTPPIGTQLAELSGTGTGPGDEFGESVAVAGTTIVVGAPLYDAGAGRAYVFTETASGWEETAELQGTESTSDDWFGRSVAISVTTIVVGAMWQAGAGRAYVFNKVATGWQQTAVLEGSGSAANDWFGESVAISGQPSWWPPRVTARVGCIVRQGGLWLAAAGGIARFRQHRSIVRFIGRRVRQHDRRR